MNVDWPERELHSKLATCRPRLSAHALRLSNKRAKRVLRQVRASAAGSAQVICTQNAPPAGRQKQSPASGAADEPGGRSGRRLIRRRHA